MHATFFRCLIGIWPNQATERSAARLVRYGSQECAAAAPKGENRGLTPVCDSRQASYDPWECCSRPSEGRWKGPAPTSTAPSSLIGDALFYLKKQRVSSALRTPAAVDVAVGRRKACPRCSYNVPDQAVSFNSINMLDPLACELHYVQP